MLLVERIKKFNLPHKQHKVIESILNDLESNALLSGQELCTKFETSFSSLTRIAKKLGYSGFPELKKEIENNYKSEHSPYSKAEFFLKETSHKSILDSNFDYEIQNIKKMRKGLVESDFQKASKSIYSARRVFIIGVGQVESVAFKISDNLKILSKDVIKLNEVGFSKKLELLDPTPNDIIVSFSINKDLKELFEALEVLSNKKVPIILFSDKKLSTLDIFAKVKFYCPSSGQGLINSLTNLTIASNILETYIFSIDKHVNLTKIKNIEEKWNQLPLFIH